MKKAVFSSEAPEPVGSYSQAVVSGSLVFASGQIGLDREGKFPFPFRDEVRRSMENLKAVLAAAGCSMNDIVKATIFLRDMNDFSEVNEVYTEFFAAPFPARAAVEVSGLPLGARVEIEAVARLKES